MEELVSVFGAERRWEKTRTDDYYKIIPGKGFLGKRCLEDEVDPRLVAYLCGKVKG